VISHVHAAGIALASFIDVMRRALLVQGCETVRVIRVRAPCTEVYFTKDELAHEKEIGR
jgi:hypothetical protein